MTPELFSALYDQTARDLLAYLLRRAASAEDAADCLAETFLIAWRKRDQIPADPTHAKPWLFGVARNVLHREREFDHKASRIVAELARELSQTQRSQAHDTPMTRALALLSPIDREIIEMIAWDQLTPREVAAILGLSPNVVRIRAHRARLKLRGHMQEDLQTPDTGRAIEL